MDGLIVAHRFRLYPDTKQDERMSGAVEACRHLWNVALADRKEAWDYRCLSTTYEDQCLMLTVEAKNDERLRALYSQTGQAVLKRLDVAFDAFFGHRAGYPKFKKFRESGSFTYPQAYNGSVKPDAVRKRLFLSKIGNVRAVFHRPLPKETLKRCTVKREPDGRWYACLVYDDGVVPQQGVHIPGSWQSPIGVDLGLSSLVATSDGEKVEPPRFLRRSEKRLKRLQKRLSRKAKGSKNRQRARRMLAAQHARIADQRKDFAHKLSARLVDKHGLVAFENLGVRNMVRNHSLAKSISDAGWSQLVSFSQYKGDRAGRAVVKVQPAYTTQECWFCATLNPAPLGVRRFGCRGCGRSLDRDVNAARIVLKRGIAKVGQGRLPSGARPDGEPHRRVVPELKPVETAPPPSGMEKSGRASSVGEAGTTRGGHQRCRFEPPLEAHEFTCGRMSLARWLRCHRGTWSVGCTRQPDSSYEEDYPQCHTAKTNCPVPIRKIHGDPYDYSQNAEGNCPDAYVHGRTGGKSDIWPFDAP